MIKTNTPVINVDELKQKIRHEVAKHRRYYKDENTIPTAEELKITMLISNIATLVSTAEAKASVRTEFPKKFYRFPFNLSQKLQKASLKILKLLFRDQREFNLTIIQSLKNSIQLNHQLATQLANLQRQNLASEDQHVLDEFYTAFEDQFRGSYDDILKRLKVYLPVIEEAKVGTQEYPILDLGCGRGEWLELLKQSSHVAKGIDINRVTLDQCRAKGFEVVESDAINYLQSMSDESVGAITGFHIIEHLPITDLIKLFNEAVRVLKPNGLIIFETPNPQNILVGSSTFYTDPTHRSPLPSPMIKFVAESQGFCNVEILELHPYPAHFRMGGSDVAERFSDYFYGPQDYAVIGYKP